MNTSDIHSLAAAILDLRPCPVVEYRLRRDVLMEDPGTAGMQALYREVSASPGAVELAHDQKPDGSWGRFHSMDSSIRSRFLTSEHAIERALAIGLDRAGPVLGRAVDYMTAVLRGEADWSDREEKSEAWFEGKKVVTAATLSLVDPGNEETRPVWCLWVKVAQEALAGGEYSMHRENTAFRRMTGVAFKKGYLSSRYVLSLLGSLGPQLPAGLSDKVLHWIWNREAGIGYLDADMRRPNPAKLETWLRSLELLSAFPGWQAVAKDGVSWLWDMRGPNGLWDFEHGMRTGFWFPLSDSWVPRGNRMVDHSTRVLVLLRRFTDSSLPE